MKRPYQTNENHPAKCCLDLALPARLRLHKSMITSSVLVRGPRTSTTPGELPFLALHPATPGTRRNSASPAPQAVSRGGICSGPPLGANPIKHVSSSCAPKHAKTGDVHWVQSIAFSITFSPNLAVLTDNFSLEHSHPFSQHRGFLTLGG